MPETTQPTVPAPTPAPAADPKPRKRGYFNKAQVEDIDMAETILAAALKNPADLAKRKIDAAYLTGLAEAIAEAREKITASGQSNDSSITANLNANGQERLLLTALQGIQISAKQWHKMLAEDDDPSTNFALDGYLIGERLNPSRAGLLQNGAALIVKAKADDLPGYDAAAIAAVQLALSNYRGLETDSDEADSEQVSDRIKRDALLKKINTRRSAIQHAADGLWPYTEESSTAPRKAFLLPPNRPLSL